MTKNDDWRPHRDVLSDFMTVAKELVDHPEASRRSVTLVGATLRFMEDEPEMFDAYHFPDVLELEDDET